MDENKKRQLEQAISQIEKQFGNVMNISINSLE